MRRYAFLLLTAVASLASSGCCFLYPQGSCFGHCGYGCGDTYIHDEFEPWPTSDPCDRCGNYIGGCDSCVASHGGECESCGGGFEGEVYGDMSHGEPGGYEMAGSGMDEGFSPAIGMVPEYRRMASGGAAYRPRGFMGGGAWSSEPKFFADDGQDSGDLLAGLLPLNRRKPSMASSRAVVYGDPTEMQIAQAPRPTRGRSMTRPAPVPTEAPRVAKAPPRSRSRSTQAPPNTMARRSRRPAPSRSEGSSDPYAQGPRPGAPVRERIDGAPTGRVYEAPSDVASEYAGSPGPVYMTEPEWYEGPAREEHRGGLVNSQPKRGPVAAKPLPGKSRTARTPSRAPAQPTRR